MGVAATNRGAFSATQIALPVLALVLLIGLAINFSSGLFRVLIPMGIVGMVAFLSAPATALAVAFLGRFIIDLTHSVGIGGTNLMVLYSGAVVFMSGLYVWMNFKASLRHPLIAPLVLYLTLMLVSGVQGDSLVQWANVFARQLGPLMMLILFFVLYQNKSGYRKGVVFGVVVVGVVPILSGVWAYLAGDFFVRDMPRLLGGYKNIHTAAHLTAIFLVFAMFNYSVSEGVLKRSFCVLVGVVALWFHTLTHVRTTTLGLLVYIFVLLLLRRQYHWLLLGILGVSSLYLFSPDVQDRYAEVFALVFDSRSADTLRIGSGRVFLWTRAFNFYITRDPVSILFGIGMGEGLTMAGTYKEDVHSDYLVLLFGLGPAGLLIYLWIQTRVILGCYWVRARSEDLWTKCYTEHMIAFNGLVFATNLLSNSYVTRLSAGWTFMAACGLLLGLEWEIRQKMREGVIAPESGRGQAPPGNPGLLPGAGSRAWDAAAGPMPSKYIDPRWLPLNPFDKAPQSGTDGAG